jgi:hypothetical protein
MGEHWISASKALEIVGNNHAICKRAHSGLLQTRAKMLQVRAEQRFDCPIAKGFWWAEGEDALTQNWATGDFSTWIDHAYEIKAFGVCFSVAGLLDMMPFEERAIIARSLSVAGNPDWVAASQALRFAIEELGWNQVVAAKTLIEQGRLGFVTARAVRAEATPGSTSPRNPHWEEREWDIPDWFWREFTRQDTSSQNWPTGSFAGRGRGPDDRNAITLSGVHFLKKSLEALRPAGQAKEEKVAAARGPKPRYDWASAVNTIWARIYDSEFTPTSQADIERALITCLSTGNDGPGESTVRPHAAMIWQKFQQD